MNILSRVIDNYLDADPPPEGDPGHRGYVDDLRTLLEACQVELELRPPVVAVEEAEAPPAIPPPVVQTDRPVTSREERRINKRNIIYDLLVETQWDCPEVARRLNMKLDAVWRYVRRYWPDHPPYDNAKVSKKVVLKALLESDWVGYRAAKRIGVPKGTVYRAMKRYGLRRPEDNGRDIAANDVARSV